MNINTRKFQNKYGYPPMPLAGESPHGGLSSNSIHYGQFNQHFLRSPRFTGQHCASDAFTGTPKTNAPATYAPRKTSILCIGSIISTTRQIWSKVVTILPQRPQKQTTATRLDCYAQRRHCHSQALTSATETTASWSVRQLVFRESHRRLETRSVLLITSTIKVLWQQAVLPALARTALFMDMSPTVC